MRFCPTLFSTSQSIHVFALSRALPLWSTMEGTNQVSHGAMHDKARVSQVAVVRPPNRLIGECQPSAALCSYHWYSPASSSVYRAALHLRKGSGGP
jgi:hypothetical protein